MSDDAAQFRIVLPGSWTRVPLGSDERIRTFAKDLAVESIGRADRLATLRRETATQVADLARETRDSGAHTLAMATELVTGVPFAASFLARDIPWPAPRAGDEEQPDAQADDASRVESRLRAAYPDDEIHHLRAGPASRRRDAGILRGKEEQITSVIVSYRIPRPDSAELLYVRFTAPDPGSGDQMAALFDAIADSIEFRRRVVAPGEDDAAGTLVSAE